MSLYQASQDDLSLMLSALAGTTITSSQYSVTAVRATTSADSAVSGGKNSKARVVMGSTSTFRGQVDVYYDRLDISKLTNFSPILVSAQVGVDISALLNAIRDMYGIVFTMADLADATTQDDGTGTGACTLLLQALAGSVGWFGSVTIKFAPLPNISTAFLSTTLTGF